jgi:hypothetical protein
VWLAWRVIWRAFTRTCRGVELVVEYRRARSRSSWLYVMFMSQTVRVKLEETYSGWLRNKRACVDHDDGNGMGTRLCNNGRPLISYETISGVSANLGRENDARHNRAKMEHWWVTVSKGQAMTIIGPIWEVAAESYIMQATITWDGMDTFPNLAIDSTRNSINKDTMMGEPQPKASPARPDVPAAIPRPEVSQTPGPQRWSWVNARDKQKRERAKKRIQLTKLCSVCSNYNTRPG